MPRIALILLVVCTSVCFQSGCNTGVIEKIDPETAVKKNGNIVLIDAGYYQKGMILARVFQRVHQILRKDAIERHFYLVDRRADKTKDGRLAVYFQFLNKYGNRNYMDLQVVFYNESGRVIETTSWEVKEFPKMVKTIYEKTSLNSSAIGYELYVRGY